MTASPIEHAAVLVEVQADIAATETRLTELRLVANYHREKAGNAGETLSPDSVVITSATKNGHLASMTQADAAETVLREAGKPLRTAAIVQRMAEGGFPMADPKRLKMSIFTTMSRKKDRFRKASKGIWKLNPNPPEEAIE